MTTTHWCRCCGFISTDATQYVFRHTDPDDPRNPALCGDCIRGVLEEVSGVEAAFKSGQRLIVVVREMAEVDFHGIANAETALCIEIAVRARQKRSVEDACDGNERLL